MIVRFFWIARSTMVRAVYVHGAFFVG